MKTDARTRYTHKVIREAFLALMKDKPYTKITVKELCDRAEINRATFYYHYRDPADLMEQLEEELLAHLQGMQDALGRESFEHTLVKVLESMRSHGDVYSTLCSANGDPALPGRIAAVCNRHAYPLIEDMLPEVPDDKRRMLYSYFVQGNSGVLAHWMEQGMAVSAEETARFIMRLTGFLIDGIRDDGPAQ